MTTRVNIDMKTMIYIHQFLKKVVAVNVIYGVVQVFNRYRKKEKEKNKKKKKKRKKDSTSSVVAHQF